jgi:dipeptidyl aminopeptidase/acylaminoacyl peptidase
MKTHFLKTIYLLGMMTSITATAQSIVGNWKGTIVSEGNKIELIFHIAESEGQYTTTLDVPLQGATGLTVDKTTYENSILVLDATKLQLKYEGQFKGNVITGNITQGDEKSLLELEKFENKLPGNTALPSSKEDLEKIAKLDKGNYNYQVADYFAKPKASSFQISPNGKLLSYMEKDSNGKIHIYIKDIATGKINRAGEEKDELIKGYGLINNERLIYVMDKGGDENYHIYGANIDGSNSKDLTPFDGVKANFLSVLKEQKDYIIISMNKNNQQIYEPYKLNIVTGELTQLYENKDVNNPIDDYIFDKDGVLRAFSKTVNGVETELYYKDLITDKFKLVKKSKWDDTFSILRFNYSATNKNEVYILSNIDSDKSRIILYDLNKNILIKEIFSNNEFDVAGLYLSRKRNYEIDAFSYEGEKNITIPVSKTYKELYKKFDEKFKNKEVNIVGFDDDETQFLLYVNSDMLYGTYYVYNMKSQSFKLLFDLMPQLKEEDMAEMKPIKFKSRDGLTIYGYITLPKVALQGQKVPMVVNPHGGPQGERDSWGFNPESQLFASRGYATLQVNFRISGGYGKKFLKAGLKQIGRKVMDDIEDGVQYAIEQGWIDKNKIAIYGGSHGGYATLMGLVKTPDLYVCGFDYCGVSNIETFFSSFPEYWKPYKEIVKEIWYDLDNPEEAKIAKEVSPVYQISKIKKPFS